MELAVIKRGLGTVKIMSKAGGAGDRGGIFRACAEDGKYDNTNHFDEKSGVAFHRASDTTWRNQNKE